MIDLMGRTFGMLLVVRRLDKHCWLCRCACGNERAALSGALINGHITTCGECSAVRIAYALRQASEYRVWFDMNDRCRNPHHPLYKHYGGEGIKVCQRWQHSFTYFLADVGFKPTPSHVLSRIDGAGDYEPSNCRWIVYVDTRYAMQRG